MDSSQIEKSLKDLTNNIDQESFLFNLLSIYDFPKATITRLKKGDGNLSKNEGEYLSKNKFLFKVIQDIDPLLAIDELGRNETFLKHRPRFLIVTDYKTFLAQDLKTCDSLDISINELADHHEFFFPWIGREKSKLVNEAVADIKAATKMGQLYDLIVENNPTFVSEKDKKHELNVFFAQLLFCLFAEDTGLFEDGIFKNTIATYSDEDGSDLNKILSNIFQSLDTKDKTNFPAYCKDLPYVGGKLFKDNIELPNFSRKARANIIEAGKLNWYEINPDIFGSMIQVISSPESRSSYGQHYTSVSNILKVINPLFMDSLNQQFESCEKEKDYEKLLRRIYALKIFDPASGSGNFLIVTFKELCRLEFRIFGALQEINSSKWTLASSGIKAIQFYALTIEDFDAQIAKLSIYITEHQMNEELSDIFGQVSPTLPFSNALNIRTSNSLHEDWGSFLNPSGENIYIIGNPPYKGSRTQLDYQKADMKEVFKNFKNFKNLDYIACWFYKASKLINKFSNIEASFISTNSVIQGESVYLLWPKIFRLKVELFYAHKTFKWRNNAKDNAKVLCVVLGLTRIENKRKKYITDGKKIKNVKNITPYLTENKFVELERRSLPISKLPPVVWGNKPTDGGYLILNKEEKDLIIKANPKAEKFIKKYLGAEEIINGSIRWCIWVEDEEKNEAIKIKELNKRFKEVEEFRLKSKASSTRKKSKVSYKFIQIQSKPRNALIIPTVSSERRNYIPMDFVDAQTVVSPANYVIYEPKPFIFSILNSRIFMVWLKAVAGRLKDDLRFSSALCYNCFPFPNITSTQEQELEKHTFNIISQRELNSEKSLAQLYNPDLMPNNLKLAHEQNDTYVDSLYKKNFNNDVKRLEFLFEYYQLLAEKNNA